jgi:hypothetical protein
MGMLEGKLRLSRSQQQRHFFNATVTVWIGEAFDEMAAGNVSNSGSSPFNKHQATACPENSVLGARPA